MTIDVIFLAFNRRAFTAASLTALYSNTDWTLVGRLVIYDDGSTDGTRELVDDLAKLSPCETTVVRAERNLGPVGVMKSHIHDPDAADWMCKIDNDCCVPPGWLPAMVDVIAHHPDIDLLGMEAGMSEVAGRDGQPFDGVYGFQPATNIGGIGMMKVETFRSLPPMLPSGRSGFSEWQHTYQPVRGWIRPDLPVALLDRVPLEPWLSLSQEYIANGWQRPQGIWDARWMSWAYEHLETEAAA